MQLKPAPGSQAMQDALGHHYVHKIVDILLHEIGQDYFRLVARFLKDNDHRNLPAFAQKLQALRSIYQPRPNAEGRFVIPPYIDELISTLGALYDQDQVRVGFQRGAIVELLASRLVCPRCGSDECFSNHRFVDGRYESDQVDVAVLSEVRRQIEGYACKIKSMGIMSEDCSNLTTLANKAQALGYEVEIGAISFDHSHVITQRIRDRLKDISFSGPFYAFGIDNMQDLGESPF